jgi:putative effector of murein hydrolase LrgA (UPF0299 family)
VENDEYPGFSIQLQLGFHLFHSSDQVYQVPSAIYLVAELSILFFPFIVTLASQFNKIQASTILIVSHISGSVLAFILNF